MAHERIATRRRASAREWVPRHRVTWPAFWRWRPPSVTFARRPVADEYPVKAAFLFNFAKFVEWPADAFKGPDDPIAICVLGQNPFGGALEDVVRNKTVANRAFVVREVSNAQQASKCQIVFVTASERKRFRSLLDGAQGTQHSDRRRGGRLHGEWRSHQFQAERRAGADRNRYGRGRAGQAAHQFQALEPGGDPRK